MERITWLRLPSISDAVCLVCFIVPFSATAQYDVTKQNKFALELLTSLYGDEENVLISPLGAHATLEFLTSRNGTSQEISEGAIEAIKSGQLSSANTIWLNPNVKIKNEAKDAFIRDFNGRVIDSTVLMAGNSFFFKPSWSYPFNPECTTRGTFSSGRRTVTCEFMVISEGFSTFYTKTAVLCELPLNGNLSMIIVQPNYTVSDVLASMDLSQIADMEFSPNNTRVTIPKFSFQYTTKLSKGQRDKTTFSLFGTINTDVFDPSDATFPDILLEASIDIDEQGQKVENVPSSRHRNLSIFTVDKPFLFFVITNPTRTIILEGIVHYPKVN